MNKRPDKTQQTKEELREAFWRLYSAAAQNQELPPGRNPLDCITVQQVVDLAGYNRGTFYLHFKDMYDLLETIEAQLLEDMTQCVASCMERLEQNHSKAAKVLALKDVVLFYEHNRRYIAVLLGAQGDPAFIPRLKDSLKPLWLRYVLDSQTLEQRSSGEVDLLLEYTLSGALFMIGSWLKDPAGVSAAEMGHLVYDLAIQGVSSEG